jgi:hypothetical protein
MKPWIVEILLFVLGVTSIFPTLWGTFVFDDGEAILKNSDVTGVEPYPRLKNTPPNSVAQVFRNDFWGTRITHPKSHKSYRPLTTLTYRFDMLSF